MMDPSALFKVYPWGFAANPQAIQQRLAANPAIQQRNQATSSVRNAIDSHEHHAPAVGGTVPVNDISEAAFNTALQKMLAEAGGKVSVTSGKRSTERQAQLWEQALKKYGSPERARKWVAPPGRSKHEKGLAADLKYMDPATRNWVHANAARYGLHFPLSNEPWHVELRGSRG